ncbi:MAG: hypothetical protein AAGA18_00925 [Verrucomicrobiota bacterium]
MPSLPDRFDLLVRRAKEKGVTPERQIDLVLGGMLVLADWHLINKGSQDQPTPHFVEMDDLIHLLIFTDTDKADTFSLDRGDRKPGEPLGIISLKPGYAIEYALNLQVHGCEHLLVNPSDYGFSIPLQTVNRFYEKWKEGGAELGQGFWIPNMTNEEEDFWQEHGV